MEEIQITFDDLLKEHRLNEGKLSVQNQYEILHKLGSTVSRPMFYRYAKGEYIPNLKTANDIVMMLGIEIGIEELSQCLLFSEKMKTESIKDESDRTLIKTVYLPIYKLSSKYYDAPGIIRALEDRIKERSSKGFSEYVCNLIREDIDGKD